MPADIAKAEGRSGVDRLLSGTYTKVGAMRDNERDSSVRGIKLVLSHTPVSCHFHFMIMVCKRIVEYLVFLQVESLDFSYGVALEGELTAKRHSMSIVGEYGGAGGAPTFLHVTRLSSQPPCVTKRLFHSHIALARVFAFMLFPFTLQAPH